MALDTLPLVSLSVLIEKSKVHVNMGDVTDENWLGVGGFGVYFEIKYKLFCMLNLLLIIWYL